MNLAFRPAEEQFRAELRDWLETQLAGEFAPVRGLGGPGSEEHGDFELRRAWEHKLGADGYSCIGWPTPWGRGATLHEQVIFHEEYARARAPGRLGHIGETLLGPTLIAFGTEAQKQRFLPPIRAGEEYWCQGYSEPNAGSDLAGVQTRATHDGEGWLIDGQKVWTSHAQWADWCFALCRTDPDAPRHRGLSYLLVPMRQAGVAVRPIVQMTGGSEFSEVYFEGARTASDCVVGGEGEGWKVAMGTLAFERGASTLGQQLSFANELDQIIALARVNGAADDVGIRRRLADAWMGLRIMRLSALRVLSHPDRAELGREALISKLYWSTWHRKLGELAMEVLGEHGTVTVDSAPGGYEPSELQRLFLFSRADTIYAGSNQIQRNIIAERALGLPREPKP
jgi:alkylation response protein AidB-like acyl-CoA dehydrogenase